MILLGALVLIQNNKFDLVVKAPNGAGAGPARDATDPRAVGLTPLLKAILKCFIKSMR